MMRQNRWNDDEARVWEDKGGNDPADRTLGLRVYSSRLIGSDPDLVMHGGGNTSVKVRRRDMFGVEEDVLHVKGSGWDLDTLLAPGLPGVRMDRLMALRALDRLGDEDMVNSQRAALLDSGAPNPSVETLLHAYLPHTFVDHTHATAFLALGNLPDAEKIIAGPVRGPARGRALHHAGLRAREGRGGRVRCPARLRRDRAAQARALHLRRDGGKATTGHRAHEPGGGLPRHARERTPLRLHRRADADGAGPRPVPTRCCPRCGAPWRRCGATHHGARRRPS
jgi:hypothetical protein